MNIKEQTQWHDVTLQHNMHCVRLPTTARLSKLFLSTAAMNEGIVSLAYQSHAVLSWSAVCFSNQTQVCRWLHM